MDRFSLGVVARVTFRSHDHTDRSERSPLQLDSVQSPLHTGLKNLKQIGFEPCQIHLSFRVAEARIELQHLWTFGREHKPRIKDPVEIDPLSRTAMQPWTEDTPPNRSQRFTIYERRGRIGAHSPGIQTAVAIQGAFVILGTGK